MLVIFHVCKRMLPSDMAEIPAYKFTGSRYICVRGRRYLSITRKSRGYIPSKERLVMSCIPFSRRVAQITLLSVVLSFARHASAGVVVVARPLVPVAVVHPVVPGVVLNVHYGWADVLRVTPVFGVARTEHHQECVDEPVVVRNSPHPGSTLLGAVVGGVLGNTVGKGDGRTAATVVGVVAGGAIGSAAGRGQTYETTTTNCHDVVTVDEGRPLVGYDVQYRYRGDMYASRLNYDPGARVRVKINVLPVG